MIHTFTITKRDNTVHTVYVDEQDVELVSKHTWHINNYGYVMTFIRSGTKYQGVSLHRLLVNPGNLQVDHINRNRLDNRRSNLRVCTSHQNRLNTSIAPTSISGYRGVCIARKAFRVRITINHVRHDYGNYACRHHAAVVANIALRTLHGDFCSLNKVTKEHELYYPELAH
jgi:hypothetical protein